MISSFIKKIKSNKGGVGIIITFVIILISVLVIIPSTISNTSTHILNKKLKSYINAAANSSAIKLASINENGNIIYNSSKGANVSLEFFEKLFDKEFITVTSPISNADYYTVTYKTLDNKIAFQYIEFFHKNIGFKVPNISLINEAIIYNSENKNVFLKEMEESIEITKHSVVIFVRYDKKNILTKEINSIVRYGSSQINVSQK